MNCLIKSSIGFELPVFFWRLIPAFSLRIKLSSVWRTLPPPWSSPAVPPAITNWKKGTEHIHAL
ncbi:MAG TPA: hypothetical protein VGI59_04600, partial [Candidatus Udaeobacter sp.]